MCFARHADARRRLSVSVQRPAVSLMRLTIARQTLPIDLVLRLVISGDGDILRLRCNVFGVQFATNLSFSLMRR